VEFFRGLIKKFKGRQTQGQGTGGRERKEIPGREEGGEYNPGTQEAGEYCGEVGRPTICHSDPERSEGEESIPLEILRSIRSLRMTGSSDFSETSMYK
jgi:hypothetical protein